MPKKNGTKATKAKGLRGWKVGERIGGSGGAFIDVGPHDQVPFVFEKMQVDTRGKSRAVVQRIDTGEVGMLPDWGLLRVKLDDAAPRKGQAFLLTTLGKEKMKKGKWKGRPVTKLTVDRLVRSK